MTRKELKRICLVLSEAARHIVSGSASPPVGSTPLTEEVQKSYARRDITTSRNEEIIKQLSNDLGLDSGTGRLAFLGAPHDAGGGSRSSPMMVNLQGLDSGAAVADTPLPR